MEEYGDENATNGDQGIFAFAFGVEKNYKEVCGQAPQQVEVVAAALMVCFKPHDLERLPSLIQIVVHFLQHILRLHRQLSMQIRRIIFQPISMDEMVTYMLALTMKPLLQQLKRERIG